MPNARTTPVTALLMFSWLLCSRAGDAATQRSLLDHDPALLERLLQFEQQAPDTVTREVHTLRTDNDVQKAQAAIRLGEMGPEAKGAILALTETLGNRTGLRWTRNYQPVLSSSTNPGQQAAKALGRIGTLAVEPLIAALSHETAGVREDVATALGQTQDRRAVDPLVAAMSNGSPGSVRHAAVRSLGQIGDIRAVSPLIAALLHRDTEVQRLARIALDALEPNWPQGDTASAIVPDLIDAMTDERFLHADSLVASLDRIDAAWRENESITQAIPGYIATYIGPVTSTESARRSDMAERVLFAISFRWQQSDAARHAVPDFIASLRLSVSGFHRGDMARDLGQIGDPLAVEPLIEALRDKETTVRWSAAESLGRLGDRRAIDPLIAALADDDDFVRRRAAEALGAIGDPRAAAPLAAAMKDVATAVQKAAAAALDQLDWQREQ